MKTVKQNKGIPLRLACIIPTMNEYADRVRQLLVARGVTDREMKSELADACGIKYQSVKGWFDGTSKSITAVNLAKIARRWNANLDWLITGQGQMLGAAHHIAEPQAPYGDDVSPGPSVSGQIPIISYVQAGEFCEAEDPFEPGMADEWLPFRPPSAGPRAYGLKVEGDSNDPRIRNGEIVIVDPDRAPDSGKFVVAKRHSDAKVTLKMIQYNEGEPFLKPGNPDWPEPIIKIDGGWSICGVVIGKYDPM
tara:strand:+ start:459 stop:1208 length:750 start_codon:yes stop_codon:yes gene_type:complete